MKTSIKATNLDLTPSLKTYINSKLSGINKLVKRFDEGGAVQLHLEIGRITKHHYKGDVFMAEINLDLPGKVLRSEVSGSDVRQALDEAKNKLQLEIEKFKSRSNPRKLNSKNKT
jgi:ribosomal subunit interface protein